MAGPLGRKNSRGSEATMRLVILNFSSGELRIPPLHELKQIGEEIGRAHV